jgi:hypothetical protein
MIGPGRQRAGVVYIISRNKVLDLVGRVAVNFPYGTQPVLYSINGKVGVSHE